MANVWLTTLPPSFADCLEILGASNYRSPKMPVQACVCDGFTFTSFILHLLYHLFRYLVQESGDKVPCTFKISSTWTWMPSVITFGEEPIVFMGIRPSGPHSRPGTFRDERIPASDVDLIQVVQPLGIHSHGSILLGSYTLFPLNNVLIGGKQWQTTPKNLPRMQRTRAIPVAWLDSGSCPN
jgi:hypothetical protein